MTFSNSRWSAQDDDFAIRINTNSEELKGWLSNSVVIEPGTKACLFQEGILLGEIGHGEWTLKAVGEKLNFLKKGQTTILITRSEVIDFEFGYSEVLTSDSFVVQLDLKLGFQMNKPSNFLLNLIGPRNEIHVSELGEKLDPMVYREIARFTGRRTISDMRSATVLDELHSHLNSSLNLGLNRYGIQYQEANIANVRHDQFEEFLKQRAGDNLKNEKYQFKTEAIKRRASQMAERTKTRNELRGVVNSDRVDSIKSKEEWSQFLGEIEKTKILKKEEIDLAKEGYEERQDDRQALRDHLLSILEINREEEIDQLRLEAEHQIDVKGLLAERELAEISGENANQDWQRNLQTEMLQLEHDNSKKKLSQDQKWTRIREQNSQVREAQLENLLHTQRIESTKLDVAVAAAERKKRLAIIEQEMQIQLATEKLNLDKQQKAWEMEVDDQDASNRLEQVRKLNEMNLDVKEREAKLMSDLEELKADNAAQREIERFKTMQDLNTETLIAGASEKNAQALADLKKTEAASDNSKTLEMHEKLNEAEKSKADAIAEAYKVAMESNQNTAAKAIDGISAAAHPVPSNPTPTVLSGGAPVVGGGNQQPPAMPSEAWHVFIDGQQSTPLNLDQVVQMIQEGKVLGSTNVWKTGMPAWVNACQATELSSHFPPAQPPGPPPV